MCSKEILIYFNGFFARSQQVTDRAYLLAVVESSNPGPTRDVETLRYVFEDAAVM